MSWLNVHGRGNARVFYDLPRVKNKEAKLYTSKPNGKENLREEDTIFVRCFEEGGLEVAPQLVVAIADEYERSSLAHMHGEVAVGQKNLTVNKRPSCLNVPSASVVKK